MTESENEHAGRRIRSVSITVDILEALQGRTDVRVTALAEELDHSKSTIHSHLQTLRDRRLVVREEEGYRLSLRFLDVATSVREQFGNHDVITEAADELAAETGEIVHFGIEEQGKVSYLCKSLGERAVETRSRVGTQQPLYSTSLGKAILSELSETKRAELIERIEFEAFTPNTIVEPEELYDELATIEDQEYAIDDEENIRGVRCVAAPVASEDQVYGAVSISGPSSRMTPDRLHGDLSDQVRHAANIIELNTKFS